MLTPFVPWYAFPISIPRMTLTPFSFFPCLSILVDRLVITLKAKWFT